MNSLISAQFFFFRWVINESSTGSCERRHDWRAVDFQSVIFTNIKSFSRNDCSSQCSNSSKSSSIEDVSTVGEYVNVNHNAPYFLTRYDAEFFHIDTTGLTDSSVNNSAQFNGLRGWRSWLILAVSNRSKFSATHQGTLCRSVWPWSSDFEFYTSIDDGVSPNHFCRSFCIVEAVDFKGYISAVPLSTSVNSQVISCESLKFLAQECRYKFNHQLSPRSYRRLSASTMSS